MPWARCSLLTRRYANCAIPGRMCDLTIPIPIIRQFAKASGADPTGGEMTLTCGALMNDGVLPPHLRRTQADALEIADPVLETVTILDMQNVHSLGSIDLAIRAKSAGTSRRYVIALIADSLHLGVHAWIP
jgi:hypothetical protein